MLVTGAQSQCLYYNCVKLVLDSQIKFFVPYAQLLTAVALYSLSIKLLV